MPPPHANPHPLTSNLFWSVVKQDRYLPRLALQKVSHVKLSTPTGEVAKHLSFILPSLVNLSCWFWHWTAQSNLFMTSYRSIIDIAINKNIYHIKLGPLVRHPENMGWHYKIDDLEFLIWHTVWKAVSFFIYGCAKGLECNGCLMEWSLRTHWFIYNGANG